MGFFTLLFAFGFLFLGWRFHRSTELRRRVFVNVVHHLLVLVGAKRLRVGCILAERYGFGGLWHHVMVDSEARDFLFRAAVDFDAHLAHGFVTGCCFLHGCGTFLVMAETRIMV